MPSSGLRYPLGTQGRQWKGTRQYSISLIGRLDAFASVDVHSHFNIEGDTDPYFTKKRCKMPSSLLPYPLCTKRRQWKRTRHYTISFICRLEAFTSVDVRSHFKIEGDTKQFPPKEQGVDVASFVVTIMCLLLTTIKQKSNSEQRQREIFISIQQSTPKTVHLLGVRL